MNYTPTRFEALAHALALAIVADSDDNARRATALAEQLAVGLTVQQVDRAKRRALAIVEGVAR